MANSGDGSVEIRVKGTVDPSVAASAAEAKSQMAGIGQSATVSASAMSKALLQAGGDVKKITPEMLGLAAATEASAAAAAASATARVAEAGAADVDTVATAANTAAHVNSRAVTEGLVLVHEALSGRYTKMTGSAMILTQAMAGQAATSGFLAAAMTPAGAAIGAVAVAAIGSVAALGYLAYQEYEVAKAATSMNEAFALTGRGAENSADGVRAEVEGLAEMEGVSRKVAEALVGFDAAHADVNARISESANQLAPQFVKAWGEQAPEALNHLKQSLAEMESSSIEQSIRGFEHLNQTMLNLKPAEAQIIEGMIQAGDQIGAVNRILADLAAQGGGKLEDVGQAIVKVQAELTKAKQNAAALKDEVASEPDPQLLMGIQLAAMQASDKVSQLEGRLKQLMAAAASPAHGEDPADAFAKSHATLLSLRDSASRAKDAVSELHREMAQRRQINPNDPEVKDYYANQAKRDRDLMHREDPGDFKNPRKARAKAGESPMTKMETELQQSEFKIKTETGDWQKDMQDFEVKFWEGKLEAAKKGSKLYGDILKRVEQAQTSGGQMKAGQSRQMALSDIGTDLSIKKADTGEERSAARADFEAFQISAQQKRDLMMQYAREDAAAEADAEEKKKAAYGADVVAVHDAANKEREIRSNLRAQLQAIDQQYTADLDRENKKRAADADRTAKKESQVWRQANSEILNAENSLVSGIIGRRQSLSQIMLGIGARLVQSEIQNDLRYLTEKRLLNMERLASDQMTAHGGFLFHASAEAAKAGATAAGMGAQVAATATGTATKSAIVGASNLKEITSHAATAAAAAYHAMAGIPVIGPALGAVAAATTFVAVEAFGALASFDKGTNSLPTDMIAQVHAGERIVPAADNAAMISALKGGGGKSVTQNNHFSPTINAPPDMGIMQKLEGQRSDFAAFMKSMVRNGELKFN